MFKELGPLLRQRTVVMILTRLEDDTIRVNVIPRKLNESENDALTTPLSVAGTAEELDAELPSALVQFVGAHLELKNTLESAKEQMAAAAKAAKAEARSKTAPKTAPVRRAAAAETKKPVDAAPKPAEPRKQEPARNASLFDIGPAPRQLPCPRRMRMRKRRFLPKSPKMSQRMNPTTWTRPRKRQS
jgi:PRTRC genetic system protein E